MWENETVVLVGSFKKRILSGKDKVRFSRIAADSAIPPFIKILFEKRVQKYLATESPFTVQPTPHFDLHPEDMAGLKGRFLDVLKEAACFREDEIEFILREALVLRLEYLIKPVDTLRRILFNGETSVTIRVMEEKLEPFSKLLPYADQLLAECRRLGYKSIERDEYGTLMSDILQQNEKGDPLKLVLHNFSVATDFLSETKGEEVTRLEGSMLQEFLADRNLWGFRRALEVESKLGKEDFNLSELELTLKRYMELKEDFSRGDAREKSRIEEKPFIREVKRKEEVFAPKEPEKVLDDELLVLAEETKVESIESDTPVVTEKPKGWDIDEVLTSETPFLELDEPKGKPQPRTEAKAEPKSDERLDIKFEEKSKTPKAMRIIRRDQKEEDLSLDNEFLSEDMRFPTGHGGLRALIDEKTEKVFIKKLFNGEATAYEKLMEKLDESESWRVAKILIDNELFKRDVDPFSREAIKLVDLIYSRYYPEEGVGGGKS